MTRSPSSRASRPVLLFLLLVLAACGDDSSAAPDSQEVTTTSTAIVEIPQGVSNDEPARLRAGTYRVASGPWSIVDYTIAVPDGWNGHNGHYLSKHEDGHIDGDESDAVGLYPVLVDEIFADPCPGEAGPTLGVGPEVDDLIEALQAQPGPATSEPVETTIGGRPATRIDLEIPEGADLGSCLLADYGDPGLQIWFSERSEKYFVLMPGYTASIYVVDVGGERQVFLSGHGPTASDEDLAELQSMLDSIRIG